MFRAMWVVMSAVTKVTWKWRPRLETVLLALVRKPCTEDCSQYVILAAHLPHAMSLSDSQLNNILHPPHCGVLCRSLSSTTGLQPTRGSAKLNRHLARLRPAIGDQLLSGNFSVISALCRMWSPRCSSRRKGVMAFLPWIFLVSGVV